MGAALAWSASLTAALAVAAPLGSALPARLPASPGRTFYVSLSGSDRAPGTLARPWRTVQHALDRLRPGQTALVRRGSYFENPVAEGSGLPDAPITLAAYPGERVVLQPRAQRGGDSYALEITASWLRVQGLVLQGARGESSADVYFEGEAAHDELVGNEIRWSQDQGVFADPGTSWISIVGNRVHDNGRGHAPGQHQSHGLYLEGSHDLVSDNLIYDQPYGFGIQLYPQNRETVVVANTIAYNGHSGIVVGGDRGVSGVTIRNNVLAYNREWGIAHDVHLPSGSHADHNLLYRNGGGGVEPGFAGVRFGGGDVGGDPRFVDAAERDFRLAPGSAAIGRADPAWTEPLDVAGTPRHAHPDLGAYEHTP